MHEGLFDRSALRVDLVSRRKHVLDISIVKPLDGPLAGEISEFKGIHEVARRVIHARKNGAAIILMMGAHVIRSGVQRYLIDLMRRGYVSCLAMNGACIIHDFELAMIGATTENVAYYIQNGQFGLWTETGILNDIINQAYREDKTIGMGEAIGKSIVNSDFPNKDISLLAAGYNLGIPITVHVGMGYDIIHQLPNCDGAATGALSYNDFLKFVSVVRNLENGVVMNFGSAVMAPEVFLKALSMARNVARQKGRHIRNFCTLVCDVRELMGDTSVEPPKSDPAYYFRPWKTMLVRTVRDGGESFYVRGPHAETVPALWSAIGQAEQS